MKLTVKKEVVCGEEITAKYYANGKLSKYGREFTGHTKELVGEDMFGISGHFTVFYGERYSNRFYCEALDVKDTPRERLEKVVSRIEAVRNWVEKCKKSDLDASGEASIEIYSLEEAIEKL